MALHFTTMPGKGFTRRRIVRKAHLKFEALTAASLRRSKIAVQRFFDWRSPAGCNYHKNLLDLDVQASEFL